MLGSQTQLSRPWVWLAALGLCAVKAVGMAPVKVVDMADGARVSRDHRYQFPLGSDVRNRHTGPSLLARAGVLVGFSTKFRT